MDSRLGLIYVIGATFDPAATADQVRLMVRSLLIERFKMRARLVTTEEEGYALVVGNCGLKIRKDTEAKETPSEPGRSGNAPPESYIAATLPVVNVTEIKARNATMSQLPETLHRVTRTPTWDRTGLTGTYSFSFRYAHELIPDREAEYPPLQAALREALGLEMKKQKRPGPYSSSRPHRSPNGELTG